MTIKEIITKVLEEINRISIIHPNFKETTLEQYIAVMGEEFGEVCRAYNDKEGKNLSVEGVQLIAATVLMLTKFTEKN